MYSPWLTVKGASHSCQEVTAGNWPVEIFLPVVDPWLIFAIDQGKTRRAAAVELPSGTQEQGIHLQSSSCLAMINQKTKELLFYDLLLYIPYIFSVNEKK